MCQQYSKTVLKVSQISHRVMPGGRTAEGELFGIHAWCSKV